MGNPLGTVFDIVSGVVPIDFQTARTSDVISLKNFEGVLVVIYKAAGTDGDDQTFTFAQGTDVAFGTNKALLIDTYYEKEGTLTAVGTWTKVTQTASATVAPGDPSAQDEAIYAFWIPAAKLDVDNGYDCIRVANDGAGSNAQLACVLFIPYGIRYQRSPEDALSSIVD